MAGTPTEFTQESVRQLMLAHGGKITNHTLVKSFKQWLTDPMIKDQARAQFKDYVNTLATIKQENGEKYLVLKKRFFPEYYNNPYNSDDYGSDLGSTPINSLPGDNYGGQPHSGGYLQQQQQHHHNTGLGSRQPTNSSPSLLDEVMAGFSPVSRTLMSQSRQPVVNEQANRGHHHLSGGVNPAPQPGGYRHMSPTPPTYPTSAPAGYQSPPVPADLGLPSFPPGGGYPADYNRSAAGGYTNARFDRQNSYSGQINNNSVNNLHHTNNNFNNYQPSSSHLLDRQLSAPAQVPGRSGGMTAMDRTNSNLGTHMKSSTPQHLANSYSSLGEHVGSPPDYNRHSMASSSSGYSGRSGYSATEMNPPHLRHQISHSASNTSLNGPLPQVGGQRRSPPFPAPSAGGSSHRPSPTSPSPGWGPSSPPPGGPGWGAGPPPLSSRGPPVGQSAPGGGGRNSVPPPYRPPPGKEIVPGSSHGLPQAPPPHPANHRLSQTGEPPQGLGVDPQQQHYRLHNNNNHLGVVGGGHRGLPSDDNHFAGGPLPPRYPRSPPEGGRSSPPPLAPRRSSYASSMDGMPSSNHGSRPQLENTPAGATQYPSDFGLPVRQPSSSAIPSGVGQSRHPASSSSGMNGAQRGDRRNNSVSGGVGPPITANAALSKSHGNLNSRTDNETEHQMENKENEMVGLGSRSSMSGSASVDQLNSLSNEPVSVKERTKTFNRMASETSVLAPPHHGSASNLNQKFSNAAAVKRRNSRAVVDMVGSRRVSSLSAGARDDDSCHDSASINTLDPFVKQWMIQVAKGDYHSVAKMLLEDPKLARQKDFVNGYTGLHWACKYGNLDLIKLLAGHYQAPVNVRSHGGYTPLHLAAQHGQQQAFDLMVQAYKADANIRDYSGKRPRQYMMQADTHTSISLSHHTFRQLKDRRQNRSNQGILRFGSLSVKVKKTTEAFNNYFSNSNNPDFERRKWSGGTDDDSAKMPPPKFAPIKKRKSKRSADYGRSRSTPGTPNSEKLSFKETIPEENRGSGSDSEFGFGTDWSQA